ncbi:Rieske (2Fe-2S) protein [Natronoarchaeum mannanilyticum]|uniref:Rieske domain-containing protein n=1 Tax=Natronoarchaeum mannanilyticum TaxID=926360 RepID=A0AAV3T8M9_9EURY
MRDVVRATVEANGEEKTVRVHDTEGEVELDDATFRFSVSSPETEESEHEGGTTSAAESRERDAADSEAPRRIAALEDVPTTRTLRCEAIDGQYGVEFILRREGDTVFAWRNSCPHEPEVRLDTGNGAIVTGEHVVCHKHGARFKRGDGTCTHGPCRGSALDEIEVAVRDGEIYLVDDRFDEGHQLSGRHGDT